MAEHFEKQQVGREGASGGPEVGDRALVIPRSQFSAGWDRVAGVAFARLARGDLPEYCDLNQILSERTAAIARMSDVLFSKMYTQWCRTESNLELTASHLLSGVPEGLPTVADNYSRLAQQLDDPDFGVEAEEKANRMVGLAIPDEKFIELAAKGVEAIGEIARKSAIPIVFELLRRETPSADLSKTIDTLRGDIRKLSVPVGFEFRAPQPGTTEAEELVALLPLLAYVGLEKLAVTGRAEVLSLYFKTSEMLLDLGVATPDMLHLPQAVEGSLQIEALVRAVYAESFGRPRPILPFPNLLGGASTFLPILEKSLARLNSPPEVVLDADAEDADADAGAEEHVASRSERPSR